MVWWWGVRTLVCAAAVILFVLLLCFGGWNVLCVVIGIGIVRLEYSGEEKKTKLGIERIYTPSLNSIIDCSGASETLFMKWPLGRRPVREELSLSYRVCDVGRSRVLGKSLFVLLGLVSIRAHRFG